MKRLSKLRFSCISTMMCWIECPGARVGLGTLELPVEVQPAATATTSARDARNRPTLSSRCSAHDWFCTMDSSAFPMSKDHPKPHLVHYRRPWSADHT